MVQSGKFGLVGIGLRIMKIKLNFNIKSIIFPGFIVQFLVQFSC